jgi:nucleotide-binding universal stress UspA family protein
VRVLCGLDNSPESVAAGRQADILSRGQGSLEFVAVASLPAAASGTPGTGGLAYELEQDAERTVRAARERWPRASARVGHGRAAGVLLDELRATGATLAVVGSHGRNRLPGILLGSVATHLLHRSPCSVLVARERDDGSGFPRSIVAGTDGSAHGAAAVVVAAQLGERYDVPVRVVVAAGGDAPDLGDVGDLGRLPAFERSEAAPVDALTAAAAGADILVVGSRGLRGPRALGSVSERVAHSAACSVLVVRPDGLAGGRGDQLDRHR